MKRNGTRIKDSDDYKPAGQDMRAYVMPSALRDTSAPCASGDKCIHTPPTRVDIRGEQCAACLRCQREMRARLRAR